MNRWMPVWMDGWRQQSAISRHSFQESAPKQLCGTPCCPAALRFQLNSVECYQSCFRSSALLCFFFSNLIHIRFSQSFESRVSFSFLTRCFSGMTECLIRSWEESWQATGMEAEALIRRCNEEVLDSQEGCGMLCFNTAPHGP